MTISDLHSEILFLTGTDGDSYTEAQRIRHINAAYSKVQLQILKNSGVFTVDDSQHTDLPIATFDLVAGQRNYSFGEDAEGNQVFNIHKIAVLEGGKYRDVYRVSLEEDSQQYLLRDDSAAYPRRYWEIGNTIVFDPIPSANITNGAKVWFERTVVPFEVGQTLESPGIPEPLHMLIAIYASLHYGAAKGIDNAQLLNSMAESYEQDLKEYYRSRRKDETPRMIPVITRSW